MKHKQQISVIASIIALMAGVACYVDDPSPEETSCAPPEGAEATCVACTGGHCPATVPMNDQVEASIDDFSGTHKAVKDNGDPNSGLSTYESHLSKCKIKVSYTCHGTAYTEWTDTSNCQPPYNDNTPAGTDCSKHG